MKYTIKNDKFNPRRKFTTTLDSQLLIELTEISYDLKIPISQLIESQMLQCFKNQDAFNKFIGIAREYKNRGQAYIKK